MCFRYNNPMNETRAVRIFQKATKTNQTLLFFFFHFKRISFKRSKTQLHTCVYILDYCFHTRKHITFFVIGKGFFII